MTTFPFGDYHVHSPYCPHGSSDPLEAYVERALERQLDVIVFNEHAPLPPGVSDPSPTQDCAMRFHALERYIEEVDTLKRTYAGRIQIRVGLEIDYLPGYEQETFTALAPYADYLDEAMLSQHVLRLTDGLHLLDYSAERFLDITRRVGGFEALSLLYVEQLRAGLGFPWESLRVKRIGHPNLPIKYQRLHPQPGPELDSAYVHLLHAIHSRGFGVEWNSAGLRQVHAEEAYLDRYLDIAEGIGLEVVFGSDAHRACDVGNAIERLVIRRARI